MPTFLVSFIGTNLNGATHGSHVVDLPEAPLTMQAVLDLQVSMAMEYGYDSAILVGWDILPDSDTHPGDGPYGYFLTYRYSLPIMGDGNGCMTYLRSKPIQTLTDLRNAEEFVRSRSRLVAEVHLVSCKALREPTVELRRDFDRQ